MNTSASTFATVRDMTDFCLLEQLPRAQKLCPRCSNDEAVYFQSQQRTAETGMVSASLSLANVYCSALTFNGIETLLRLHHLW